MPSPSKRHGRKRAAAKRKASEMEVPEPSPPPTQSAAKKRRTIRASPEPVIVASPELEPLQNNESDDTTSNAELQEVADAIIPLLIVSTDPVAAATDWANTKIGDDGGSVSAYAKVCGREWTFYVKRLNVNIGRPPDGLSRQSTGVGVESSPPLLPSESEIVHIDLGPNKLVSRFHAELFFDHLDSVWNVNVKGRNGVKINDLVIKRGNQTQIKSGDVLEIAGTQMMFVTAEGQAVIHPMFMEKLRAEILDEPEPQTNTNQSHSHPETQPVRGRRSIQTSSQTDSGTRPRVNGQAAIAPAPPNFIRPTTPVRSPRKPARAGSAAKPSPAFARGIVMESNEQIDYSSEAAKDMKPGLSYATMISQAILSTPEEYLSLKGIYDWIAGHFAYYRHLKTNWQNSIRHNLSLNPAFHKFPRGNNEPGKGSNWCINPEKREELVAAAQKQMSKSGARPSSAPSSPAIQDHSVAFASSSSQPYAPTSNDKVKLSPTRVTPPIASYPPTAQESYTPSRGPHLPGYEHSDRLPILSDDPSPLPHRFPRSRLAPQTGSSPTLTSGGWMLEGRPMMTPAPRQHNLNLPLPNTAKLPTSHMPDSSPAPFWKYNDHSLSTPAKWPEISPLKAGPQSSSPPAPMNGNESPSRKRGIDSLSISRIVESEEDGGIDLARGFPNISLYHHRRSNAAARNATFPTVDPTTRS